MTNRVTIQDKTDARFLSFDLQEILSVLPPAGSVLSWRLLELHGVGKPDNELNWLDLEQQIDKAAEGVKYSWTELMALASGIFQSYDLTLIGTRDPTLRCQFPIDLKTLHDFVLIEAFDSSYWTVTSDFPEVIEAMQRRFHDTEIDSNVA